MDVVPRRMLPKIPGSLSIFNNQLDLEIKISKLAGSQIRVEMDFNAKLGPKIITGDPKEQSENEKLLEKVIAENDLVVVNGTELCNGVITRHRNKLGLS